MTKANSSSRKRIAVIPGDGVGKEVIPEAVKVLKAAAARAARKLCLRNSTGAPIAISATGRRCPARAVEMFRREYDAIFFGALGDPRVPGNQHGADILLGLRFKLDLYVNARPCVLFDGRLTPLKGRAEKDIQITVFRENTEGLYVGVGGFFKKGTAGRNCDAGRHQHAQGRRADSPLRV